MKTGEDKEPQILLGDNNIQTVTQSKHIGIERNTRNIPDTKARTKTGRQTVYVLMGAGMYGCNGISPIITSSMWTTFVIPRVLHGIEMLDIRRKDLQSLERFQRKCLKQLQGLPTSTASAAVYYLLGAFPVEWFIDQRFLSTFGNILQNNTSLELNLAKRQLLHKNENPNSWFIKILEILTNYNLPNPLELLEHPPKKEHWKSHLWFAGVRECPPWCSIVGATVTVHQFFCILHFCHTCSLCRVELVVQFPARCLTQVLLCLFPGVLWL